MNKSTSKHTKIMIGVVAILAALLVLLLILVKSNQKPTQEPHVQETEATVTTVVTDNTTEEMPQETDEQGIEEETISEIEGAEAGSLTYSDYMELPVEEQQAYYENFQTPEDFFDWMDAAKEEHAAITTPTETKPGDLTIEEGGVEDWE